MHRHITYYTHNQLSARVDSTCASPQINFLVEVHGRMQDLPGGLGEWHVAKRLATRGVAERLLGGFLGMLPREILFKWCNLVRFGAYFHTFFTLKKSRNIHFNIHSYQNNDKL